MYPQLACRESGAWWEPDDKEDTENHSGVAVRTVLLLSRLCRSRVKGKHHDGESISWAAFVPYSGGTANSFVL